MAQLINGDRKTTRGINFEIGGKMGHVGGDNDRRKNKFSNQVRCYYHSILPQHKVFNNRSTTSK